MKQKWIMLWLLLLLGTGCVNVDYIGQQFEPVPEDHSIRLYSERETPAPGEYQMIGRMTLTAPEDYTRIDLEEKLQEAAREHGSDAVQIVSLQKRLLGSHYRQPAADAEAGDFRFSASSADGARIGINSFGEPVSLEGGEYRNRYEIEIKALLLMEKSRYQQLFREREQRKQHRQQQEPVNP